MSDSIRRGALSRLMRIINTPGDNRDGGTVNRVIDATTIDGLERAVGTIRSPLFGMDVLLDQPLVTGEPTRISLPDDLMGELYGHSRSPNRQVDLTHTHPPGHYAIPSLADMRVFSRLADFEDPIYNSLAQGLGLGPEMTRNPELSFGVLGTGQNRGDAFALDLHSSPSDVVSRAIGLHMRVPEYDTLRQRLRNDSSLFRDLTTTEGGQRLMDEFPGHMWDTPTERAHRTIDNMMPVAGINAIENRFPGNLDITMDMQDGPVEDMVDRFRFYGVRNNPYAEGGLVEPERPRAGQAYNRFRNPFQRRSLEDTRRVNPSWADRVERQEYDRVENMPRPYSMPEIQHEVTSNLIGVIPGGETGMYLAGRRYSNSPSNVYSAVGRDLVNLVTLPMGFLPGVIAGESGGILADIGGEGLQANLREFRAANDPVVNRAQEAFENGESAPDVRNLGIMPREPSPQDELIRGILRDRNDMMETFRTFNRSMRRPGT